MISIGIDPSMNSTGVCIYDDRSATNIYYIIPATMTRKMSGFDHPFVKYRGYDKVSTTGLEYSEKESVKTENLMKIIDRIDEVIDGLDRRDGAQAYMEGISYGSAGAGQVADLAGLNYLIRATLHRHGIPFKILPPTQVKKFAVGNGSADKDTMIAAWKKLDKNISSITEIKIDDCADAFFLAHYKE